MYIYIEYGFQNFINNFFMALTGNNVHCVTEDRLAVMLSRSYNEKKLRESLCSYCSCVSYITRVMSNDTHFSDLK